MTLFIKAPRKRGNILAETLRKMLLQPCFPVYEPKQHLILEQNVSEKAWKQNMFAQKILRVLANGETIGQQCFRNDDSSTKFPRLWELYGISVSGILMIFISRRNYLHVKTANRSLQILYMFQAKST